MNTFDNAIIVRVNRYVKDTLHSDDDTIVTPFTSGYNYRTYDYTGKQVVDFPPFSQINEIIEFYNENSIKYFLYIPSVCDLIGLSQIEDNTVIDTNVNLIDKNLTEIGISFVTNLISGNYALKTAPQLRADLISDNASKRNAKNAQIANVVTELGMMGIWLDEQFVSDSHTIPKTATVSESVRNEELRETEQTEDR